MQDDLPSKSGLVVWLGARVAELTLSTRGERLRRSSRA